MITCTDTLSIKPPLSYSSRPSRVRLPEPPKALNLRYVSWTCTHSSSTKTVWQESDGKRENHVKLSMHSELRAASAPTKSYSFLCFSRLPRGPLTSNSARTRALSILGNAGDGTSDEIRRGRSRDLANIMYTHIKTFTQLTHTDTHTYLRGRPRDLAHRGCKPPRAPSGWMCFIFIFIFIFILFSQPPPCTLCVFVCIYMCVCIHK